jgi:hypothetical protein
MSKLQSSGSIEIVTGIHKLQYEADSMTGGSTAFFSVNKKNANVVPVHVNDIDDICEALQRVKGIILAVEPPAPAVIDGVSEVFASTPKKPTRA